MLHASWWTDDECLKMTHKPDTPDTTLTSTHAELTRGCEPTPVFALSQLKAGDVLLKDDGLLYRILRYTKNMGQARAASSIMLDLIEVGTGTRSSDRMRAEQTVEVAQLNSRAFQVRGVFYNI